MSNTELYLRILDQFPNPIWRSGLDAKCDFFNKDWLEFTGRTMEQEKGDGWAEGVHPEDLARCVSEYLAAFEDRKPFKLKYRLKYNDGTYRWILDFGNPFYLDDGSFAGYIGSCYDINDEAIRVSEIERLNSLMLDRELRMVELKKKLALYEGVK